MNTVKLLTGFLLLASLSVALPVSAAPDLQNLTERTLTVRAQPLPAAFIPRGARRVRMLRLRFTASCDADVRVWSVTARRVGLGDAAYVRGVYLLEDAIRLTRSARITSDQTVALRPKNLVIPACKSREIDIAADFSATTPVGSEYYFRIENVADIISNADNVNASFPINNPSITDISPADAGGVSVSFLNVSKFVPVRDSVLARFRVTADRLNNYLLSGITLKNDGNAKSEDVRNLYITRYGGNPITSIQSVLDDDYVSLEFFSPYFLKKGNSMTFELHGTPYTRNDSIEFILKEESDLRAVPARMSGRNFGE